MGFESLTSGMGTGAFGVLLLRMTMKEFSATQYALFSSLFALPRILAGPVTGVMVDAIGWHDFFLFTIAVGIPGMLLLQRFAPLGVRDPEIKALAAIKPDTLTRSGLIARAAVGGLIAFALALVAMVVLTAFKQQQATGGQFDLVQPLTEFLTPQTLVDWMRLFGALLFAAVIALAAAATAAARSRGIKRSD
jgi:PAT family beta-lactamase induction signal transducer AmpG